MFPTRVHWLALLAVVFAFSQESWAQRKRSLEIPPPQPPQTGVKTMTKITSGTVTYYGAVESIKDRTLTLTWDEDGKAKSRTFEAIDILADGGLQVYATGMHSYLWSDVKKGDTLTLTGMLDQGEDKWYCVRLCITRRPGGKVPEPQRPTDHPIWLLKTNVLNDIENGLDVPDDEVDAAYPTWDARTKKTDPTRALPEKYRKMLDAVREKAKKEKDKDLKATPPEKK